MHGHQHAAVAAVADLERETSWGQWPLALRTEDPQLARGCGARQTHGGGVVRRTARDLGLSCRTARVIRDELHLCSRAAPTVASIVAVARNRPTCLTAPLLRVRLDENATIHVDSDDLDHGAGTERSLEAVVHPGRRPRRDGPEQCGTDRVLVEGERYRVDPMRDPPDPTF